MNPSPTALLPPLLLSALILSALGVFAWRHRRVPGAAGFLILMGGGALWSLAYGAYLTAATPFSKLFWVTGIYTGIALQPVGWLTLALEYTGRERWLSRGARALLWGSQLATVALVATTPWQRFFFARYAFVRQGAYLDFDAAPGPGFWLNVWLSYALIVLAMGLLLHRAWRAPGLYRWQVATLVGGWGVTAAANVLYLLGESPVPGVNLTPFLFPVKGALLSLGIFRFGLLSIVPVARDAVIEEMADGVLVLDPEQRVVDLNPAAQALLGVRGRRAVVGRRAAELPLLGPALDRAAAAGSSSAEVALGGGEERRVFDLRTSELTGPRRTRRGTLAVVRDITERERAARALADARDAAEEASRAKSRFLATMSHELRTPLTGIIGYSELLLEEEATPAAMAPDLEHIRGAGLGLLRLIDDILDLSKVEAGRLELKNEPFAVAGLVDEVAAAVAPVVEKRGNRLRVELAGELGTAVADPVRVRQVLLNLVGNAVKFTAGGTITVAAARETGRRGADTLVFRVSDTGIGIPPEQLDRIWEPFTQADASTTRRFGGTGLGLAVVERLCRLMGAGVEVESEPGRGSLFTVRLPVGAAADGLPAPAARPAFPASPPPAGATVLVVDDSDAVRGVVARVLRQEGYRVEECTSGDEMLASLDQVRPDVITLDAMMPGMTGAEAVRRLRADPARGFIPVLMLTGVEPEALGVLPQGVAMLPKPIHRAALLHAVGSAVRSARAPEAAAG